MGVGFDFACKTCKTSYYIGYGSYGLWICPGVDAMTVEQWDAQPKNKRDVPRNRHLRDLLAEHVGHNWTSINWDVEYEQDGKLWIDGYVPGLMIEDYGLYTRINLQDVEPKTPRP